MADWTSSFSEYRRFKEIAEVLDDVERLRFLYYNCRYDEMCQHITELTRKYPFETTAWNSCRTEVPKTEEDTFRNAEEFLKRVAIEKVASVVLKDQ